MDDASTKRSISLVSRNLAVRAADWRGYLQVLWDEIDSNSSDETYADLRQASLLASTFSYIEWLAHYYSVPALNDYPKIHDISAMLQTVWHWSAELSTAFWKAGRHPLAHVGYANAFYPYASINGTPANVMFNTSKWSQSEVDSWRQDPERPFLGAVVLESARQDSRPHHTIIFNYQVLLEDLLPKLESAVRTVVEHEHDPERHKRLLALDGKISTLVVRL